MIGLTQDIPNPGVIVSPDDASQVHLRNRFIVMETDTLKVGHQSPGLLKAKVREVGLFAG
jgi:hypothetical protein